MHAIRIVRSMAAYVLQELDEQISQHLANVQQMKGMAMAKVQASHNRDLDSAYMTQSSEFVCNSTPLHVVYDDTQH